MAVLIFDLPQAKAITAQNIWQTAIPSGIIFVQIYLLLGEANGWKQSSKALRLALLPLACAACWHVFAHLVVPYDQLKCFNFGVGVAMQHLVVTSVRWALASEPPRRLADAPQHSRFVRAVDLLCNARMVGYEEGPALGVKTSRIEDLRTHLQGLLAHYLWYDISSYLVQKLQPDGFGSFRGGDVVAFARSIASKSDSSVSSWAAEHAIRSGLTFTVGWLVYHGICLLWHVIALLAISAGYSGVEFPRLMDQPLLADGMLDFWKRWHQLIRGLLMFTTSAFPKQTPRMLMVIVTFFFSGLLHTIGQLVITRQLRIELPSLSSPLSLVMVDKMARFFIGCGCCSVLEVTFKDLTGRKVRGWPGRVWLWAVMLIMAQGGAEEWFAMGFVGSMRGLIGMAPVLSAVEWARWVAGAADAPWRRIDMS